MLQDYLGNSGILRARHALPGSLRRRDGKISDIRIHAGYQLDDAGACKNCGTLLPGRFQKFGKPFGPRRIPVRLETRV